MRQGEAFPFFYFGGVISKDPKGLFKLYLKSYS